MRWWGVLELLGRLLISSAILTVPFCLLTIMSRRAGGLIWLLFPFFYVPVFLVAAVVVFMPVEKFSSTWDWPVVPALMVAGGALGALVAFLAASRGRKRTVVVADIVAGNTAVIGTIIGLVTIGAAMGAVWHLSQRVVQHFGTA